MFKRLDEPMEFQVVYTSDHMTTPLASFENADRPGELCHLVGDGDTVVFYRSQVSHSPGGFVRYAATMAWPKEVLASAHQMFLSELESKNLGPEDGLPGDTTAKELKARAQEIGLEFSKGATSKAKMIAEIRAHLEK